MIGTIFAKQSETVCPALFGVMTMKHQGSNLCSKPTLEKTITTTIPCGSKVIICIYDAETQRSMLLIEEREDVFLS